MQSKIEVDGNGNVVVLGDNNSVNVGNVAQGVDPDALAAELTLLAQHLNTDASPAVSATLHKAIHEATAGAVKTALGYLQHLALAIWPTVQALALPTLLVVLPSIQPLLNG